MNFLEQQFEIARRHGDDEYWWNGDEPSSLFDSPLSNVDMFSGYLKLSPSGSCEIPRMDRALRATQKGQSDWSSGALWNTRRGALMTLQLQGSEFRTPPRGGRRRVACCGDDLSVSNAVGGVGNSRPNPRVNRNCPQSRLTGVLARPPVLQRFCLSPFGRTLRK